MLTPQQAFVLGYTVPVVGIHFNGVEFLANVGEGATGELEVRVKHRLEDFAARRPALVGSVRHVMALLSQEGIDAGEPPRLPDEYYRWAERIRVGFNQRAGMAQPVLSSAHALGQLLGGALLMLNVGALTLFLLDARGDDALLLRQAEGLRADQEQLAGRLAGAVSNPLLAPAALEAFGQASEAFRVAPPVGQGDHIRALDGVQRAIRAIVEKANQVERALAEG